MSICFITQARLILLREGERNVFIAECKIWKGPNAFGDTIDQFIVVTFKPKEVAGENDAEQVLMHSANTLMLLSIRLGLLMNKCLLQKQITFRGGKRGRREG